MAIKKQKDNNMEEEEKGFNIDKLNNITSDDA